jgi:3-hydroxyisobutyrate dehydrogenase-like beta-hydroxyacid dehydrogenase
MREGAIKRIAIIGFGEAGGIFATDLSSSGLQVAITDIVLGKSGEREAMLDKAGTAGVAAHANYRDAIAGCDLVISAVTSSSSLDAALEATQFLESGQIYLDINSVSPDKKREIARAIDCTQAKFVEAAVMAPVSPQRLKVPMLLGGAHAEHVAALLSRVGMNAKAVNARIGVASAIKMCRSLLVKGFEALTVECLFAARRYEAEEEVLDSLDASYPAMGWKGDLPDYLVSRVAQHGRRRAAEMREVAAALRDVAIEPHMALATAVRQDWLVDEMASANVPYLSGSFSWKDLADALRPQPAVSASKASETRSGKR